MVWGLGFLFGFFSDKSHTIALGFTSITRSVFWSPDCVSGCQRHHKRSDKNVSLGSNSQQWPWLKCCLSAAWVCSWWNDSGKCSEGIKVRGQCSMASVYLVFEDLRHLCLFAFNFHGTAGPILSTEDTAALGSWLTTNHSPDAFSVHWSLWEPCQRSCWLHWQDAVRGFNWGFHSHPFNNSNKLNSLGFPLSEPAPSPPCSPPTAWVLPQHLTLEAATLCLVCSAKKPQTTSAIGCEEPNHTAVSRTAAGIWEPYNAQTCKGWELEASSSHLKCPASEMCNWSNAFGDMLAMSSQIPGTAASCCTLPWTGWLLWFSTLSYHCRVINPNKQNESANKQWRIMLSPSQMSLKWSRRPFYSKQRKLPKGRCLLWDGFCKALKQSGSRCHQHNSLSCSVSQ